MAETMTTGPATGAASERRGSLRSWQGWYYLPGIAFLVIGILALAEPPLASLAATVYVGAMLCVGGVFMAAGGIANIGHRGGWIALILGVLSVLTGLVILGNPIASAVSLVWIMGAWLIVGGLLELAIGFNLPLGRGWLITVSLINILLGIFALTMQPAMAFAFLGYFVGISLVMQGFWSLIFTADLHGAKRSVGN